MKPPPKDLAAALVACLVSLVALARSDSGHPAAAALLRPRPQAPPASSDAVVRLRAGQPLELNQASASDLVLLPGVGPKLAARIVDERARRGGFAQVDELRQVKGVGPAVLARVRPLLRVSHPTDAKRREAAEPTGPPPKSP
jgi:competence ComEA-like helix-hairpin-helix protein